MGRTSSFGFNNTRRNWRNLRHSLGFIFLLVLVACQQQNPELNVTIEREAVANPTTVLILYNDSIPAALLAPQNLKVPGSNNETTPTQRPVLKPGLVSLGSHNEAAVNLTPFSTASLNSKGAALSAQAFSYNEAAQIYSIFLANLVGRYQDLTVLRKAVSSYQPGDATKYLRTFYIGSTYGDLVPPALITDTLAGAPVTWLNYQIWNLVPFSNAINAASSPLGISYTTLHSASDQSSYTTTYNKIDYKGFSFDKFLAPMEMAEVKLEKPTVTVQAWAKNSAGRQIPYALQSGNFWYIADNPFNYIHETDRYLVFADLIGPMLGRSQTCEPRAIARMEDLSPNDTAADLKRMLDSLRNVNIPFAAATIPLYKNNTTGVTRTWQNNNAALKQLRRVPGLGGRIFQHGYTHQYEGLNNPFGETGVDFEFWQATDNGTGGFNYIGPIPGQTPASALQRMQSGRSLLIGLGLNPSGWVTPHYAADPSFYAGFNTVYPRVMERRLYRVGSMVAGQFFPYPVKDVAGTLILPETLGSLQPGYLLDRVMAAARANRVLSCPWAGHFFHAYTINPTYTGVNAISAARFEQLLRDIQALGYRYVDPTTVTQQ
jgi:uncharacterized protein YdaL